MPVNRDVDPVITGEVEDARAAGSSAPACSPRFVVVSDLPEWTVWDQERQRDLFPTKSGNRDNACRRCGEDTAHLIADALNAYTANARLDRKEEAR
jgi:hypothetical protein